MLTSKKIFRSIIGGMLFITVFAALGGCNEAPVKVAEGIPAGFSNVSDVPIPESAKVDMTNTTVVGGHDRWTGQLSYTSSQSQPELIDFINSHMQRANWTKISELRGKETVFSFIRNNRVAVILVSADKRTFSASKTFVSIGMTNSKLTVVDTEKLLGPAAHDDAKCPNKNAENVG